MTLKVTINLPNQVSITVEADEADLMRYVVRMALREVPADLMQLVPAEGRRSIGEISISVARPEQPQTFESAAVESAQEGEARDQMVQFCRRLDPVADMRRIVVAAAGAHRFLGIPSVSSKELGELFDLAEWPRPSDFVQTLRNASRSKFRWLERVPGGHGYYSVTEKGTEVVLGAAALEGPSGS